MYPLDSLTLHHPASFDDPDQATTLRGWDAADEMIAQYLTDSNLPLEKLRILLVNDLCGALSCTLNNYSPDNWSDSLVSHLCAKKNAAANSLEVHFNSIKSTERLPHSYDLVIIKLPKTLALLEHQLAILSERLHQGSVVISGCMVKYMQHSHTDLLQQYIGDTHASRAQKKARLLFTQPSERNPISSPYPITVESPEYQLRMINHANVFSLRQLDIGSRFLLQQLNQLPATGRCLDLGCGNGLLGITIKRMYVNCELYFSDESYMALASAKESYHANISPIDGDNNPHFIQSNVLDQAGQSGEDLTALDMVVCNPPFHQQNSISDHIAKKMFKQSYACLRRDGFIWVIANRHLNYHHPLKRLFGNCRTVASNNKFVLLEAQKRRRVKN